MKSPCPQGFLLALGSLLSLAGCGGGGGGGSILSGGGGTGMSITSCSLGCSSSSSGSQVSCGVTDVFVNQEIRVAFSSAIDLNSVSNNSFQIVEAPPSGKTPPGTFALDPVDPRVLIYRPQLTFDSAGNPIFGLTAGKTYFLKIPGTALDSLGPFIENTLGQPNATRLQCTLVASRGVFDTSPGPPRASVLVDIVTGYDPNGDPVSFAFDQPATGAENVFRGSDIRIVFDDVMNPGTLANPVTGTSSSIRVSVDADGDTVDDSDRVPLLGTFTLTIDQSALRTTVIFHASGGLPSAGSDTTRARKVVVEMLSTISDLGSNPLINPGTTVFTPERITFQPFDVSETFDNALQEDSVRTGSPWGGGALGTGPGGGSGRLGDLVVLSGEVVELDTDSEDFSLLTNPASFNPLNVLDRPDPLVVTGGVFEFSRLRVDAGGILRFLGSKPARLYVRGETVIQGQVDIAGLGGALQISSRNSGGVPGEAGPGGGKGGRGGLRPDGSAFRDVGGVGNPGAGPTNVLDPATYSKVNGLSGEGIPFPSAIDPDPTLVAAGHEGLAWPQPHPTAPDLHMPKNPPDVGGMQFDPFYECRTMSQGAPGGGGGYALPGKPGIVEVIEQTGAPLTPAPPSAGGDSGELAIDDAVRSLSPELGFLRGGSGGGGGGSHIQLTRLNSAPFDCEDTGSSPKAIAEYVAHSAAGGGGGGGALQIAAGRRMILNGVIDASGGDGGSGSFPPPPARPLDLAQAGGAGSGGAVLLQSQQIQIQNIPIRIKISGGRGGEGTGGTLDPRAPSRGGDGSPGLLRLEANTPPNVDAEKGKIVPTEADLLADYGTSAIIEDIFTSGVWSPPADVPSGSSGAQSCWIRPSGNFFQLVFLEDGAEPAWDMRLRIAGHAEPQSFRGENDVFPGQTLESVLGTELGSAAVVVRFQAARSIGTLVDPCSVPETGVTSPLLVGSPTEWVRHPSELSTFHGDELLSLTPNIFRFVIVWNRSHPLFDMIEGLEDITITVRPD